MFNFMIFLLLVTGILTGCSGEKCCADKQSENIIDPTSYTTNGETQLPNTNIVAHPNLPEAVISYEDDLCNLGEQISFSGLSSKSDTETQLLSYEWLDNDTIISTDSNITLSCDTEGQKEICLQVTDDDDVTDKKCHSYTVTNGQTTLPPIPIISIGERTKHGFWFDCSKSYDPDNIDTDHNASNNNQIIKATWEIYKTKNGERAPLHTRDICRKWVGVSDDLDFMEVTLIVTDDDNETASVTEIFTWDGHELVLEP